MKRTNSHGYWYVNYIQTFKHGGGLIKKVVLIFLICLLSFNLSSQVNFRLSAGTIHAMADDLPFNGFGYHVGVGTIIPIARCWNFVPQIRLATIEYQKFNSVDNLKMIEVPLSLEYGIKLKKNNYFILNFGAFGNLNVGGMKTVFYDAKTEENAVVIPAYQKTIPNPYALGGGLLVGLGYEINRFYLGLEPNFRYNETLGAGLSINTKIAYRF